MIVNKEYKDLFFSNSRYVILMGGRGAGRSTVASQYALAHLRGSSYSRCAIMRFVLGDIRNSIYQDILDRIEEEGITDVDVKEHSLTFECGKNKITGIGFRKSSGEQKSKLKSLANYNCIIIEEADEINEEDFIQLDDSLRTIKADVKIILLLNPPNKNHWIIKRWFNLKPSDQEGYYVPSPKEDPSVSFIYTDYSVNLKNLSPTTIANYENYKTTKSDHYYSMIKGYVSDGVVGRIFKNWRPITNKEYDELPYTPFYGLDFGFSSSPTALIELKKHNNKVWVKELLYKTQLTNPLISSEMKRLGVEGMIMADSAEPKSIEELRNDGWNIFPCIKGVNSIKDGVATMLGYEIYYTEDSLNLIKEVENYKWAIDRNKEPTNNPHDSFNHCMDACRYALTSQPKIPTITWC